MTLSHASADDDRVKAAAFYDTAAGSYDADVDGRGDNRTMREAFRLRVSELAGAGNTILDFGCGTGSDAEWYANRGHRVIAYDISTGMLDALKVRCAALIADGRVIAVAGALDVLVSELHRTGPVTVVAANFAVLNHVRHLGALLRVLEAHLAPQGAIVTCMLSPFYWRDMIRRWWWQGFIRSWSGAIRMVGGVTTYRHYLRAVRKAAHPQLVLAEQGIPDAHGRVAWRNALASNFLILVLRRPW